MFDFLKYTKIYYSISGAIILAGLLSVLIWGFRYSIDFVGGTNLEYRFNKPVVEKLVREVFAREKVEIIEIRQNDNTYIFRTKPIDEKKEATLRGDLQKSLKVQITPLRSETVGPVIGKETIRKTSIAALIAIIGIL